MSSQFKGELDLCGVKECIVIDWNELDKLELIQYIKTQTIENNANRIFIGIAGGPGAGKTLFSKILSLYLNEKLKIKNICISADGYHYENKILIEKGIRDQKGLPNTMNDKQLYQDILKLKNQSNECVYLPIYDREIHNPVQNAIKVENDIKVIIFEGLYMIYWNEIKELLDYIVFMDADKQSMKYRLENRKIKCGSTKIDAQQHYFKVDFKTTEITQSGKYDAHSIIKSDIIDHRSQGFTTVKYKQMLSSKL